MTIHIIDEQPDIYLTRGEHDRLQREYQQFCAFHASPPTFEEFVRARHGYSKMPEHGSAVTWCQS